MNLSEMKNQVFELNSLSEDHQILILSIQQEAMSKPKPKLNEDV